MFNHIKQLRKSRFCPMDISCGFHIRIMEIYPDIKVHWANMGPTPYEPNVGPMNLAIRVMVSTKQYVQGNSVVIFFTNVGSIVAHLCVQSSPNALPLSWWHHQMEKTLCVLNKQSSRRWYETAGCSMWHHRNVFVGVRKITSYVAFKSIHWV